MTPDPRPISTYHCRCLCGAEIVSPTREGRCRCGLAFRIDWGQWVESDRERIAERLEEMKNVRHYGGQA